MRSFPLVSICLLPWLCSFGPEVVDTQVVPSASDDSVAVLTDFLKYIAQANLGFKSPQEKQEAQQNFQATRKLVKMHNSRKSSYKVKIGRYSHLNSAKRKKVLLGMRKARTNRGQRLRSAPAFDLRRHRGALTRAQKQSGKGRRTSRQLDGLQSLLSLFQSFGGGGLPNINSLGQGVDFSQLFGAGGGNFASLFGGGGGGGGGLPNPFQGGGGGFPNPFQGGGGGNSKPVSPTRNPNNGGNSGGQSIAPATLDWRQHNYVRSVKDQGVCGSCYTFSSVAAIEGQMMACFGDTTDLSEQNPLSCAQSYGAGGCDGGDPAQVFDYAKDHGIETDQAYPYVNKASETLLGVCTANPALAYKNSFVASHQLLPEGDEEAVKNALNVGPLSACMDAGSAEFQQYDSGVYDGPCTQEVNHAVLLVGYGTDPVAGDYWLVKNSWGTDWGEQGYFRLKRNAGNKCGIASYVQYPTLKNC